MTALTLQHGLAFEDLYRRDGLARLDAAFVAGLAGANVDLHNRFVTARANPDALAAKDESSLLISSPACSVSRPKPRRCAPGMTG